MTTKERLFITAIQKKKTFSSSLTLTGESPASNVEIDRRSYKNVRQAAEMASVFGVTDEVSRILRRSYMDISHTLPNDKRSLARQTTYNLIGDSVPLDRHFVDSKSRREI